MSIKVSLHYWDQAAVPNHTEKLVLLALADWCNDEGWCFPSIPEVARRCSLTDRGVQKVMARLIETGHLRIEENAGRRTGRGSATHRYYLLSYQAANGIANGIDSSTEQTEKDEPRSSFKGERGAQRVNAVQQRVNAVPPKGEPMRSPDPSLDPSIDPISPPARAAAPAAPQISPAKPVTVRADSPHMPPGLRLPGGYVPAGTGVNPVQVYYERFHFSDPDAHLNRPQEDDLARLCPDLDRLREVITAYSRTNYRRGNVQLILDWYRNGAPQQGAAGSRQSNRPDQSNRKSAGYGYGSRNNGSNGSSRQECGGKAPQKGLTPDDYADDPEMFEFLSGFVDARDAARLGHD